MCDLVTLVMCVSLALVASSALPVPVPADGSALRAGDDCQHECLLRTRKIENESRGKSSCDFKLLCGALCRDLVTPRLPERLLRSRVSSCRPRSQRSRNSRSPAWAEATLIARSVGLDVLPDKYSSLSREEPPSNLRVTSLTTRGETVDCQLTWDSRQGEGEGWFLVTWETEAAGRGNLLTPSSPVTLTLLPASRYHVQVSPSNSPEARVSLDVDTHRVQPPQSPHHVLPREQEAAAGLLAAMLLLLGLGLISVTRRRATVKSAGSEHSPKHFKVYSPPVTIVPVHLPTHSVN